MKISPLVPLLYVMFAQAANVGNGSDRPRPWTLALGTILTSIRQSSIDNNLPSPFIVGSAAATTFSSGMISFTASEESHSPTNGQSLNPKTRRRKPGRHLTSPTMPSPLSASNELADSDTDADSYFNGDSHPGYRSGEGWHTTGGPPLDSDGSGEEGEPSEDDSGSEWKPWHGALERRIVHAERHTPRNPERLGGQTSIGDLCLSLQQSSLSGFRYTGPTVLPTRKPKGGEKEDEEWKPSPAWGRRMVRGARHASRNTVHPDEWQLVGDLSIQQSSPPELPRAYFTDSPTGDLQIAYLDGSAYTYRPEQYPHATRAHPVQPSLIIVSPGEGRSTCQISFSGADGSSHQKTLVVSDGSMLPEEPTTYYLYSPDYSEAQLEKN